MKLVPNLMLKTKLVGGFVALALITGAVGGVGLHGLTAIKRTAEEVNTNCLPSTQALLQMQVASQELKVSQRTLLALDSPADVRKRQHENIAKATAKFQAAWKVYEPLPQAADEAQMWEEFCVAWKAAESDAAEFMRQNAAIEKLDLGNPYLLDRKIEGFRADHHKAFQQVLEMCQSKRAFDGGDDPHACNLGKWLEGFRTANPEMRDLLQALQTPHQKFHDAVRRAKETVKQGNGEAIYAAYAKDVLPPAQTTLAQLARVHSAMERALDLIHRRDRQAWDVCRGSMNKANEVLDKLVAANVRRADRCVADGEASGRWATLGMVAATAAGLAFALGLGVWLTLSITRPVLRGVAFAKKLAQGDLSQTLDIDQRDEIGQLAGALNEMSAHLREMFGGIARTARTLGGSANELSSTASQLADGAEQTTKESATVASAAEQMSTNMTCVAASSEQMSANVKTVASAVEQLTASISEVARSAEQAASVAGSAAQLATASNARIGELGSAADEIGKVIGVIQDIAEQTNLLALNATIEAARAGDAGKGFAVVATEVKELARQTAGATEDIRKRIEGIQGSTGEAIKALGQIGEVIGQVNDVSRTIATAVEEQSITTKEIARSVAESSSAAESVARGVAESASASHEITRNIAGVDQAARNAAQGAAQTQDAGRQLSQSAEQLQSLLAQFQM